MISYTTRYLIFNKALPNLYFLYSIFYHPVLSSKVLEFYGGEGDDNQR